MLCLCGKPNSPNFARANTAEREKPALGLRAKFGAARRGTVLPGPAQTRNDSSAFLSGLPHHRAGNFFDRVYPLPQCRSGRRPLAGWPTRATQRCLSQALAGWAAGGRGVFAVVSDLRFIFCAPPAGADRESRTGQAGLLISEDYQQRLGNSANTED